MGLQKLPQPCKCCPRALQEAQPRWQTEAGQTHALLHVPSPTHKQVIPKVLVGTSLTDS